MCAVALGHRHHAVCDRMELQCDSLEFGYCGNRILGVEFNARNKTNGFKVRQSTLSFANHRRDTVFSWLRSGFILASTITDTQTFCIRTCCPEAELQAKKKLHTIRGWDRINVPFPSERRTLRLYFELVAEPGDKFHIRDPRPKLPDQYFVLNGDRKAELISENHFYASGKSEVAGVGLDDRSASFYLRQWGEITQRYYKTEDGSRDNLVSFAFTFSPAHYLPQRLRHLRGLPNLTELQLEGCAVEDDDLKQVALLPRLRGIGLNNTGVTDEGIKHLAGLSALDIVETEGTRVSRSGLRWLQKKLKLQH